MLVQYGKWLNGTLQGALWTVVFFMAPLVSASRAEASSLSAQDRSFFEDAALATLSEIEFGKIAVKKAVDPQVRAFASRNVTDYTLTFHKITHGEGEGARVGQSDLRSASRLICPVDV